MTDSLRDQLLGLGFKPAPRPERKPERKPERPDARKSAASQGRGGEGQEARRPGAGKPFHGKRGQEGANRGGAPAMEVKPGVPARNARPGPSGPSRPRRETGDIDLAKAYAIRAQREKEERIEAERLKQEQARLRREAKAQVEVLLQDQVLNDPEADIARHFEYGGKIKRVHVNAAQLPALNAGQLGVVQQDGRYLLVSAAILAQAEALFPACIALKVDPDAPGIDELDGAVPDAVPTLPPG